METLQEQPMGVVDRLKAAGSVIVTGKLPNPLASEPADRSRGALVKELRDWCVNERRFWKPVFDRIQEEIDFAGGDQWGGNKSTDGDSECYTADIVQRHLQQKEAALYAKKPTFTAVRRKRLEYRVWDGNAATLAGARNVMAEAGAALMQFEQAAQAGDAAAQEMLANVPGEVVAARAIVKDFERVKLQRKMEQDVADTLNLIFDQQLENQCPPFKLSMKQLVTQVNTARVGWVKLLFRREMDGEASGEQAPASGMEERLQVIRQKFQELAQPDAPVDSATAAELQLMLQSLNQGAGGESVASEGVVLQFLPATSVIISRETTNLRGLVGCKRLAHETMLTVAECEREYGVNLRDSGAKLYPDPGAAQEETLRTEAGGRERAQGGTTGKVCVWHIYDRTANLCYTVADGVRDFLKEPYTPQPEWDFFWPILPLTFRPIVVEKNDPDKDVTCYPRSDVRLLMPMQKEKNRSREAYREHRIFNRPRWVLGGATTDGDDLEKLSLSTPAGSVLRLKSLAPGEKIADKLQMVPQAEIDPKVYDTSPFDQDALQVVGTQPANLGVQAAGEKATGQAIAEGSRIQSSDSNVDDLETFLDLVAEGCCLLLMDNLSEAQAKRIAGAGAVWPPFSVKDMRDNIWLEIAAGSTGRPNKVLEIQNFRDLGPQLKEMLVAEGKSLRPLIKEGVRRLDDALDLNEFDEPGPALPAQPMGARPGGGPMGGIPAGQVATNVPAAGGGAKPPPIPAQPAQAMRAAQM